MNNQNNEINKLVGEIGSLKGQIKLLELGKTALKDYSEQIKGEKAALEIKLNSISSVVTGALENKISPEAAIESISVILGLGTKK